MTYGEFKSGLRVLDTMSRQEMMDEQIIGTAMADWKNFSLKPHLWMLNESDYKTSQLWRLMQKKMP